MTQQEKENLIAKLEAAMTPRGAYEAMKWGNTTPEGRKFLECRVKIRMLEEGPGVLGKAA